MKHRNIFLIIISILIIAFLGSIIIIKKNKEVYDQSNNYEFDNNTLSIMLEETPKMGDYKVSNLNEWPDDSYVYNSYLSYCENGSKLNWNDETRMLTFSSSFTDKCYLYFDLYILPVIESVAIDTSESSISLNVNAIEGDYPIEGYVYKIDEENEVSNNATSYKFTGLSSNIQHTISVYAQDTNKKKSKIYSYTLPTISAVNITNGLTSIGIDLTAISGTNEIDKYYFSKNNGSSFVEQSSGKYTFTNLQEGTTYNLKIYSKDKNGVKSMFSSKSITTKARPTAPNMNFDSNYNVMLSGSKSNISDVKYFYSTDNKTFTEGTLLSLNSNATIYAYAMDNEGNKSNIVTKNLTINDPTNGTVSTAYYCSKSGRYQTSSSCSYTYAATAKTELGCTEGTLDEEGGFCYISNGRFSTWADCNNQCSNKVYNPNEYPCSCYYSSKRDCAYLWLHVGNPTNITTYSCSSGTLSGTKCTTTYTGTTKYKCSASNSYYDSKTTATSNCTNYCPSGSLHNSKCYKLG